MRERPILLVEDNADDVVMTLRAFRRHHIGNEIVVTSDGVEALAMLGGEGGREPLDPSVVLLDLNLPRMGGLELLQHLRADARTAALPVVVLTTSNEERDIVESYRLGASSFVRKPVAFTDFVDAARFLGLSWVMLDQSAPADRAADVAAAPAE